MTTLTTPHYYQRTTDDHTETLMIRYTYSDDVHTVPLTRHVLHTLLVDGGWTPGGGPTPTPHTPPNDTEVAPEPTPTPNGREAPTSRPRGASNRHG